MTVVHRLPVVVGVWGVGVVFGFGGVGEDAGSGGEL